MLTLTSSNKHLKQHILHNKAGHIQKKRVIIDEYIIDNEEYVGVGLARLAS